MGREEQAGRSRAPICRRGSTEPGRTKFDLIGLVAWIYDDLEGTEERQIRANLRIEGRDGQCARVRRVEVSPGPSLDVGVRGGGSSSIPGLSMTAKIDDPAGGFYSASAFVTNDTDEPLSRVQIAFTTPPGFGVSRTCSSGSGGGGVTFCNIGGSSGQTLLPGERSSTESIRFQTQITGMGIPVLGYIAVMHNGVAGQVFEYAVETGTSSGVANLRGLAQ